MPQNCEAAARFPPLAAGRTDVHNGRACVGCIDRSEQESHPEFKRAFPLSAVAPGSVVARLAELPAAPQSDDQNVLRHVAPAVVRISPFRLVPEIDISDGVVHVHPGAWLQAVIETCNILSIKLHESAGIRLGAVLHLGFECQTPGK